MKEGLNVIVTQKSDLDVDLFNRLFPDERIDKIVQNKRESLPQVEGLRVAKVYITLDVLTSGMDVDLLGTLYNNMIRMNIKPSEGFVLLA